MSLTSLGEEVAAYYAQPAVEARMVEYLGGASLEAATAVYVTGDDCRPPRYRPRPPLELGDLLRRGLEVGRSVWDRSSLLAHLDLEYVHFDDPVLELDDTARSMEVQRPLVAALLGLLHGWGIDPLHLLSGRGHHLVWLIRRDAPVLAALAALGHVPRSLERTYRRPRRPAGRSVGPQLGRAWAGLGMLMEYVAHRALELAGAVCPVPIKLTAIEVGPGPRGREIVSIDVSEYGDPLHQRSIRLPFSVYLKPWRARPLDARGPLPWLVQLPLGEQDEPQARAAMRDPWRAARLASRTRTRIPDGTEGTATLLEAYSRATLARFHEWYYEAGADCGPAPGVESDLPPCVRHVLEQPNDRLLKPAGVELVTRVLAAEGWHPRSVAALVRSRFEAEHGWSNTWRRKDRAYRADFYTRLAAGLLFGGSDELVDLNCKSNREKGYCSGRGYCGFNLEDYRDDALVRKRNERLGRRPFDGLLPSNADPRVSRADPP